MGHRTSFSVIIMFCISAAAFSAVTYFEDFNNPGKPAPGGGNYWYYVNNIHPDQNSWREFVPGDGFAYIKVDADVSNDTDPTFPYQIFAFGTVGPGHRLEIRMKGAVVPGGLVGFIFIYNEVSPPRFNEIDIELVADDQQVQPNGHDMYPPGGWTDIRLNTWRNADPNSGTPLSSTKKMIENVTGNRVSHLDGEFHTYTLDWRVNRINYYIDDVLQDTHTRHVATGGSEVIIGFRDLKWDGAFKWSGVRECVIDWFSIEPLRGEPSAKFAAASTVIREGHSVQFFDQSPTARSWKWNFPGGTPSISTEKNPVIIYSNVGTYDVTLTATNTSGSKTCTKDDYISVLPASEIAGDEISRLDDFWLYPNPSHGLIQLQLPANVNELIEIEIFDVFGRIVSGIAVNNAGTTCEVTDDLVPGIYVIRVKTDGADWVERFTVLK